ncbi:ATP-binding protein [Lactobacillus ultunensis]|uniref:AAA domain-containing protein n=1 Tax=Lactobacillus ultunensis DSM 16047 TaxID=525365 RepID=C2ENZ5_9LACO|nr:ATP-binding protein [Lactobacillus ultunensis]EEJ71778.1 hypothetical protein HMPREF0548_1391 [Lactobacillus ultunensis DSM 16047]KRL82217.1 AAA+ superfamily ATPase [Lactobacillus ultunensis DSM 16047]QQP28514.1 ATP-binding protein [Lactobacillus ultunensis]
MLKRTYYLNQLKDLTNNDFVKVITGVRRSGKSVLLMQYRDYLKENDVPPEDIIYLNMESYEMSMVRDEATLHKVLDPLMPKNHHFYLLLDEIQNVDGWQRVINGVRVSFDCDITVTGSNAKMLSGELATMLSGRYVQIPIYPFSFKEFLQVKGISEDSDRLIKAFREYRNYGGFPAVVLAKENIKDTILSGIYDAVILNDVAARGNLRDISVLRDIVGFLADDVGQLIKPTKIANTLTSNQIKTNVHTVQRYMDLLEDAFLFYKVDQYDLRGKKFLSNNGKYFIVDTGLRRQAIGRRAGNYGNQLENIVYLELKRRGYDVSVGKLDDVEIDFIARKVDDVEYIQVTRQIPENTHETDNLLKLKTGFKRMVITEEIPENTRIEGIPIVNVVDWLLDNKNG